jgi:hypothetical protein
MVGDVETAGVVVVGLVDAGKSGFIGRGLGKF